MLDKRFNREKWTGEVRYVLLSLHNRKGYTEMSVLKSAIWLNSLMDRLVSIPIVEELNHILASLLFWEFGNEVSDIDFTESKENFEICNNGRKKELIAQNDFIDAVCENRWSTAYKMIENQINDVMNVKNK
jgi:hypothetical protein